MHVQESQNIMWGSCENLASHPLPISPAVSTISNHWWSIFEHTMMLHNYHLMALYILTMSRKLSYENFHCRSSSKDFEPVQYLFLAIWKLNVLRKSHNASAKALWSTCNPVLILSPMQTQWNHHFMQHKPVRYKKESMQFWITFLPLCHSLVISWPVWSTICESIFKAPALKQNDDKLEQ